MRNGKSCIKSDTYERWQNAKMANYVSHRHIQKKDANEMTCQSTHIINITCLTLLSWPMVTTIAKYVKYTHFKNTHMAAYSAYVPTPPKSFHPSHVKNTQKARRKT